MDQAGFQRLMDDIAAAFMARDFDRFLQCTALPLTHITNHGPRIFETEDDVRGLYEDYVAGLDLNAVDQIVRAVRSFNDGLDGTYIGDVETHFLNRGRRIAEPHTSAFLATDTDEGPKVVSVLGPRNSQEAKSIAPIIWET